MYKLQRIDVDGTIITLEFPTDLNIWDMRMQLRCFLMGCSFMEKTVDQILPMDDLTTSNFEDYNE